MEGVRVRHDDDATVLRERPSEKAVMVQAAECFGISPPDFEALPISGSSALVRAAYPLLSLAATLRTSCSVDDVGMLWNRTATELRRFESRATDAGLAARTVSTARYVLCAVLDEAVLQSSWGARSPWHRKSLLMAHHGDTYGGETFFVILDRLCVDIERHIDLAELMYACLLLGFGGRHLVESDGALRLGERRDDLHRRIAAVRAEVPTALSPAWQGLARPPGTENRLLWIGLACALCVVVGTWFYLRQHLVGLRTQVEARLGSIAHAPPPRGVNEASTPVPAEPNRYVRYWIDAAGGLDGVDVVDEGNGRTVVRLFAAGWFPSGASAVPVTHRERVGRLARALDHVRGAVVVVGHSDDQPIRMSRFRNNVELSLARARNVAGLLAEGLHDPTRVSFRGVGDAQPIALPVDLPEHRERNRRVDIVFHPEVP